jgi:hypothetical protein
VKTSPATKRPRRDPNRLSYPDQLALEQVRAELQNREPDWRIAFTLWSRSEGIPCVPGHSGYRCLDDPNDPDHLR